MPVATVLINWPVTLAFPAVTLPVTLSELNVPTLVILGCAASFTVLATVAEAEMIPVNKLPLPLK